ncbi:MAG: glycosyltransferase [Patulibacter minatonensis]
MRIRFVLAHQQNHFFVELALALVDEFEQLGVHADLTFGAYPEPAPEDVYVLLPPHEYVQLTPEEFLPSASQRARTIYLCGEQPGSWFFDQNVAHAREGVGAVFDINPQAVTGFRRKGIAAEEFPLGWTRTWSHGSPADETPELALERRDLDVLHLGISTPRRGKILAGAARHLDPHRTRLVLGDDTGTAQIGRGAYLGSHDKWQLMERTRVLLNVHQDDRLYFEWLRVVQAIQCGVAVVSEPSVGHEPLVAGEHILFGPERSLGLLVDGLVRDEERRHALAVRAEELLREVRPMRNAVARMADVATDLLATTAPVRPGEQAGGLLKPPAAMTAAEIDEKVAERNVGLARDFPGPESSELERFQAAASQALKDQRLAIDALRRQLAQVTARQGSNGEVPRVRRRRTTPSYAHARPQVSVLIALFNYEEHVSRALDSVARSIGVELEIVVVDDGSTDGSAAAVDRWIEANPAVPVLFLEHPVNRSLGPARNTALGAARGEYVFILDADNEVKPRGITRLIRTLENDQDAVFAYGPLEQFDPQGEPVGLISQFPWQPWRFRNGNYIDAMVLWRRSSIEELGGYATDLRLYGWEDYDLFCRVAERGLYGAFTPEVVARYRVSGISMLQTTNLSTHTAIRTLVERHPRLLGDVFARAGR